MAETTTHSEAVEKLSELIKDIDIGMLTTVGPDGHMHSRPMSTQKTEFDGNLWFFTNLTDGKVGDIEANPHVNVAYSRPNSQDYVSVAGTAELVRDRAKIEELWSPVYKAWFPDGIDDPNVALLKVKVDSAEYWDSPSSPVAHILSFIKAATSGETPSIGENKRIDF